jgi:prevent-host-death family protein
MHTIGVFEAKAHFSELLEKVEHGEEITITRHGKAVARVVPVDQLRQERAEYAVKRLRELSEAQSLEGVDWKELREEGRR